MGLAFAQDTREVTHLMEDTQTEDRETTFEEYDTKIEQGPPLDMIGEIFGQNKKNLPAGLDSKLSQQSTGPDNIIEDDGGIFRENAGK